MFAGLSFITRMTKHLCERLDIGNLSEGDITSESFIENELGEVEKNNSSNINNP